MRRWGELLLAGHRDAIRSEGEVELPDIYDPAGGKVRLPVEPRLDLIANAERYFHRARRTEKSLETIETRLNRLLEEIEYLELLDMGLEDVTEREDFETIREEVSELGLLSSTREARKARGRRSRMPAFRRFRGSSGCSILVGRTGRSNEKLTFEVAQPGDLWFHAADVPGAHVILKRDPPGSHPREDIEEAAALAAYFSKARGSTAVEVIYTPRKHVRKIPSAPPGTVRVSRFDTMRVKPELVSEVESS
jgi:predicted ribosome quality control (RQC) complex YloA/Tae2 family protein